MLFDTHCHLNFNLFNHDVHQIIKKTLADDVWILIVGTNRKNSARAVQLALQTRKGVYAAVGIHPVHLTRQKIQEGGVEFTTSGDSFDYDYFRDLVLQSRTNEGGRVVAIGESGIDYFYTQEREIIDLQRKVFVEHLKLADELLLPIIIHARGSNEDPYKVYDDLIRLLEHERLRLRGRLQGVVHSFYGTFEQAERLISMGLTLGINALVKNDQGLAETLKFIDLSHLVIETDAPYFHPGLDDHKRNEPKNVIMVSEYLAKIKNKSMYEISEVTTQNALHLFNIVC